MRAATARPRDGATLLLLLLLLMRVIRKVGVVGRGLSRSDVGLERRGLLGRAAGTAAGRDALALRVALRI